MSDERMRSLQRRTSTGGDGEAEAELLAMHVRAGWVARPSVRVVVRDVGTPWSFLDSLSVTTFSVTSTRWLFAIGLLSTKVSSRCFWARVPYGYGLESMRPLDAPSVVFTASAPALLYGPSLFDSMWSRQQNRWNA